MGGYQSLAKETILPEDYIACARTGDLVLWASDGTEARVVKFMTASAYSHIGIVIVLDTPLHAGDSGVYMYHSPSGAIHGLVDHFSEPPKPKQGPQLNDMRVVLDVCRRAKSIEIRRLTIRPGTRHAWSGGAVSASSETVEFARSEHSKVYETSLGDLFRSAYDGPGGQNERDLSSYFCSELVAEVLQRARVLVSQAPSDEFTPADFTSKDPRRAPLADGFAWGKEIKIVYSHTRTRGAGASASASASADAGAGTFLRLDH